MLITNISNCNWILIIFNFWYILFTYSIYEYFENKLSNKILMIEYKIQKYRLDDLHDSALNESNSFEVNWFSSCNNVFLATISFIYIIIIFSKDFASRSKEFILFSLRIKRQIKKFTHQCKQFKEFYNKKCWNYNYLCN